MGEDTEKNWEERASVSITRYLTTNTTKVGILPPHKTSSAYLFMVSLKQSSAGKQHGARLEFVERRRAYAADAEATSSTYVQ